MAARALITVNAVAGSDTDLPIDTLVQLGNSGLGDETTYLWEIVWQPDGATTDALSNVAIQAPTFTPTKEGSYLIKLTVNAGQSNQSVDQIVAAVLQLKTRTRVPAVGETDEVGTNGWAEAANETLQLVDSMRADPGIIVCAANIGGLSQGNVVWFSGNQTIKDGLDGQELVPRVDLAVATSPRVFEPLGRVVGPVDVDGGAIAEGDLIYVRRFGYLGYVHFGILELGDPLYVSNSGTMQTVPGTHVRRVGTATAVPGGGGGGEIGGFSAIYFDGAGVDTEAALTASVQTTTVAVTTLLSTAITTNTVVVIEATVGARNTGAAEAAGYRLFGTYRNVSGTVTQVGLTQVVVHEDVAGWDATFDISTTNVRLRVTGENAKTINWVCRVTKLTVL